MGISKRKKLLICEFHSFCCEGCKRKFPIQELEIHRLIRGGDYNDHRILKILCKYKGLRDGKYSCHFLYHSNEFQNVKAK